MSDEDRANAIKDEGNALLSAHKYPQAAEKYTEAISILPNAIFYSNRAQALIKMESYGLAIEDANEALKIDPNYIKAYYRRGSANYAIGKTKEALKDFKTVVKIVPKDPDALKKMKACEKAVKDEAFRKAILIESREEKLTIDVDNILVENYNGPRLEGGVNSISINFAQELISFFKEQRLLHRKYVIQILLAATDYFKSLPSLLRLQLPPSENTSSEYGHFTVCGDTHGQFYDLCNIFEIGGFPSPTNPYLFNGDFVDRGSFSFEVVMTLIVIKLACPTGLYMLRGNHETKNMNSIYGFQGEILHKYDETVMKLFTDVFNNLPLAAVIQDSVFVVHGGISTTQEGGMTLKQVEEIPRNREPPESGLMSDLLWSDPMNMKGQWPSKRGVGYSFGPDYTEQFLNRNNLQLLVRSHEVKDEGYAVEHDGKCITIFSAPNYW